MPLHESLPEALAARIEPEPMSGCWLWIGQRNGAGYGVYGNKPTRKPAHRVVYEALVGPITPAELTIDHLCRNPSCVNPRHLEPVPERVNLLRGISPTAINARKTHCPKGHAYERRAVGKVSSRWCRTCFNEWITAKGARLRDAAPIRPCRCGCGTPVPTLNANGRPRLGWIHGHHRRKPRP